MKRNTLISRDDDANLILIEDHKSAIEICTLTGDIKINGNPQNNIKKAADDLGEVIRTHGTVGKEPSDAATKLSRIIIQSNA